MGGLEKSGQSTLSDTLKEVIAGLNALNEKRDHIERKFDKEEKLVHLNFSSISNCLPDYGSRLEVVENNNAKYHHWRINSFEETLASLKRSERWGVASSSAKFPLSSPDGFSSGDDESSDPSSGNDEPMARGRDRQESAEIKGPVDMQSALSDRRISSPSPADVTANKKSVSSEGDVCSDLVPGIGESKSRGRVRRKKLKKRR